MPDKTKVAILGGGYGALSTAWFLTRTPELQAKYDVTIYQLGWRLGGKGATGRNEKFGSRIEEHGLHVWYGYYENAFALIQEAYAYCQQNRLAPQSPFQTWRDAFQPQSWVTLMESVPGADGPVWSEWITEFPSTPGTPGDGVDIPDLADSALRVLRTLLGVYAKAYPDGNADHRVPIVPSGNLFHAFSGMASFLHAAVAHVEESIGRAGGVVWETVAHLLRAMHDHIAEDLRNIGLHSEIVRHVLYYLDLGIPAMIGCIEEDVFRNGLASLDDMDLKEFLAKYGAVNTNSPVIRSLYDGIFAFDDGDPQRPNLAAGAAMRGMLRLFFTYKESVVFEMQAGMGETVVSPLYLALKHKGVKFRFFQRVLNLVLSPDKSSVDGIEVISQATVQAGAEAYDPLRCVVNLPCWPSHPDYTQLAEGEALQASGANLESNWNVWDPTRIPVTLRRGSDFDLVVLAIPPGAHPKICSELIAVSPAWRNMVDKVTTTATFAFQLWLTEDVTRSDARDGERILATGFGDPVQNFADMTHVLSKEDWQPVEGVKSIQYFFGPFQPDPAPAGPDPSYAQSQEEKVEALASEFLTTEVQPLFHSAVQSDGSLDWSTLVAPPDYTSLTGRARLRTQFLRANIDPSELYVLSGKGSIAARLHPGASGFENLFLAGDWTVNVMNIGCIEGTVSSGMACAQAISGVPLKIIGGEAN